MNSKLRKHLCTVTPFTKIFAMILFVLLPLITLMIGLYLGIKFGKDEQLIIENEKDLITLERPIIIP